MKKYFYLFIAAMFAGSALYAAPGDTTWVQAFSNNMDGGGNYDSTVTFPTPPSGVTYRNIYLIFTLGKHTCPGYTYGTGAVPWCGDWDYTIKNQLMTPGGDTMELGRLISPYANASAPRTPYTWKQHYVFDVTDYASKLRGSATSRIQFDAGSGGWTGDVKFMFIEGTPDRTVTDIRTLWMGSFGYGGTPDINVHFPAMAETAPAGTASAALKVTVTGHGGDGTTCCEFQSHNYQVMLNGTSVANQAVWRDNCGLNELYPQSGTWLYNRANWCPGAIVYSNMHNLPGITTGSSYTTNIKFDDYTGSGYYITVGTLISYGPMNKTVDAGITQIVSPTIDENFFRENPLVGAPVIRVKNSGAATINSISFQYGLQDSVLSTYTWYGTLAPLADTDIVLPSLLGINAIAGDTASTGLYTFAAKITAVNGAADVDATNDILTSQFVSGPVWPAPFRIYFRTNNEETSTGSGISETEWKIYDVNNNVVASRTGVAISTLFTDTVTLHTGAYKLVINDGSCDGLYWWANDPSITAGYLNVRKATTAANIAMHGYSYTGQFANDFGCNFTQYFYINNPFPAGVNNVSAYQVAMDAYPNPAQGYVNVDISGLSQVNGTLQLTDVMGRTVITTKCNSAHTQLSLKDIRAGIYTVEFVNEAGNKMQSRLLVTQ